MTDVTILPFSPEEFWSVMTVHGFTVLSLLIYAFIAGVGKDYRPPIWEKWRAESG